MSKNEINNYVQACIEEYKRFVGIDDFPAFSIKTKELTLEKSKKQGFDSPAAVFYDVPTGAHTLEIWTKLSLPQMHAKYLVFHEFTHIWDAETFSQKDKIKHMSNKGYTEFHAAQIDFMQVLGAKSILEPFSFSVSQKVETFGGTKTAEEFLNMPLNLAVELISREDFPANIETLATTMGAIFNYYGRRSICKMYATDYNNEADTSVVAKFLGIDTVKALDGFMLGWFDEKRVALIDSLYGKMIVALAQRNNLG